MSKPNLHIVCKGGIIYCNSSVFSSREAFNPIQINMVDGKAYGINGAIGSGNWAICRAISTPSSTFIDQVVYNGNNISLSELENMIFSLDNILSISNKVTVHELIEESLMNAESNLTVEDIKTIFHLSDSRFERPIEEIGLEIYRLALAKGMIEGKKLFVFPFIGESNANILDSVEPCFPYMLNNDKIILMPYDRSLSINYLFDYIITMRNTKLVKAYKNLKHLKLIQHSLKQYFLRKFLFLKDKYRRWS